MRDPSGASGWIPEQTKESKKHRSWWKQPWFLVMCGVAAPVLIGMVVRVMVYNDRAAVSHDADHEKTKQTGLASPRSSPPCGQENVTEQSFEHEEHSKTFEDAFESDTEFLGTGTGVMQVEIPQDESAIAHIAYDGESNFQVIGYAADAEYVGVLVNQVGPYNGVRPINFKEPVLKALDVVSDGDWKVTMQPLRDAQLTEVVSQGSGDAVLLVSHHEASNIKVTHTGDSNFQVTAWGSRRTGMINEIGSYDGRVRVPGDVVALEIVADGSWIIDFSL